MNPITPAELAAYFDHTQLRAYAQRSDFEKLCAEAREYGFAMVAINPAPVSLCKDLLAGTSVHVGAAVGFPLGQSTPKVKKYETVDAIANGADEIDYVINITLLIEKTYDFIEHEMAGIVEECRGAGVISKVIFENCYLTEEEKAQFVEGYLSEGDFGEDDSIKIFPVAKSTELLFLNDTDWQAFADAAGVRYEDLATMEGLTAAAEKYYNWTDAQTAAQLNVNAYGVYVVDVAQGGPADKAGLKTGDRIVSIDGTEIAQKDDLGTLIQQHAAGDTLSITVAREGQMQTVSLTLGEKNAQTQQAQKNS